MHNGAIMSSKVRHLVEYGLAYPLVRLTGVLDAETAGTVRSVLLDVLATQPEAMVVDVAGLEPDGPGAISVLATLRRDTADWPAAHLVLCSSHDRERWRDAGWPVWPDSTDAFAELGKPDQYGRLNVQLEPQIGAARKARELITEACGRWDRAELAGPACIVATEMVNNVVAHAHTPMIVLLAAHGAGMSVAVRDSSRTVPRYTGGPVSPTAYGGRGMLLIDSVSSCWGSLVFDSGKVVWALLDDVAPDDGSARDHHSSAGMTGPARG
jgi:anti-anti-sigma regulatory factor